MAIDEKLCAKLFYVPYYLNRFFFKKE